MSLEAVLRQRAKTIRQRLMYPPNPIPDTGIDLKRPKIITRIPPEEAPLGPRSIVSVVEQHRDYQPNRELVEVLEYPQPQKPPLLLNKIIQVAASHYGISSEDIKGPSRKAKNVLVRRVVVQLALRLLTHRSIKSIGRGLQKDHSSILHGRKAMLRILPDRHDLRNEINLLEDKLRADYHC